MKIRILTPIIACLLCVACGKQAEPRYIAGYITEISESQIVLEVPDSTPSQRLFAIDSDTSCDEGAYYEGNIAEVTYMPADEEGLLPQAINIASDMTYPRVQGRWQTDKDDKLHIDIILQPFGKVAQILPTDILQFNSWQLTGVENEITLHGTLSLPPSKEQSKNKDKESKEKIDTPPSRHMMHFSAVARLADDDEGNTEQHKVLIITTDKGRKSKLYPAGR